MMEASDALAGQQENAPVDEQAAPDTPAQADPAVFERIDERFNELGSQLQDFMERQPAQAQAEPDYGQFQPQQQGYPQQFQPAEPQLVGYDPNGEPIYQTVPQQDPTQLLGQIVGQQVGPVQAQLQQLQDQIRNTELAQRSARVEDAYPELRDEKTAKPYVDQAVQFAIESGLDPEQAVTPELVELVYKASKAQEQAAAQTPAEAANGTLEGANGAGGLAEIPAESIQEAIVSAGPRTSLWP